MQDAEQLLGSQGSSEPRRGLCQKSEGTDLLLILQPPAESAHMLTPHLIKQSKEQKPFCSSYFSPESITALLMARHHGRRRHFLPFFSFFPVKCP